MTQQTMDLEKAKAALATIDGFQHCNSQEVACNTDYVRASASHDYIELHGGYTTDQLEALVFWRRNPELFA